MDINATLFGQMIVFALFVVFTMKVVWPPLMRIMEERRNKIADGLAASEQGKKELELAKDKISDELKDVKLRAGHIIEQATQRANQIIEESKAQARVEGERLLVLAQGEIKQEYNSARAALLTQVSELAVAGAEKILQHEVDKASNNRLINDLVEGM
jgi:F-type H+-transporting ATPase subunit b